MRSIVLQAPYQIYAVVQHDSTYFTAIDIFFVPNLRLVTCISGLHNGAEHPHAGQRQPVTASLISAGTLQVYRLLSRDRA